MHLITGIYRCAVFYKNNLRIVGTQFHLYIIVYPYYYIHNYITPYNKLISRTLYESDTRLHFCCKKQKKISPWRTIKMSNVYLHHCHWIVEHCTYLLTGQTSWKSHYFWLTNTSWERNSVSTNANYWELYWISSHFYLYFK